MYFTTKGKKAAFGATKPKASISLKTDVHSHYNGGLVLTIILFYMQICSMYVIIHNTGFLSCNPENNFGELKKYKEEEFYIVDNKGKFQ